MSVRWVSPVGAVVAYDILHIAGDHAERDHACLAPRQPQRYVITLLDLVAVPGDRPALQLIAMSKEFPHPPLGGVALHQPMRHETPFHRDCRTLAS
jgi:hypothetical protein